MLNFAIYREERFKKILEKVYDIKEIDIPIGTYPTPCTFFRSNKPFKKELLFNLPFHFYNSLHFAGPGEEEVFFAHLESYSQKNGVNITITSLDELSNPKCVIVAHNPVLQLAEKYEDTYRGFSANLRSGLRRNANKACDNGVTIERSESYNDLQRFYLDVLAKQYVKKHKMVFQPFILFKMLFESGMASLFVARSGGEIIGGLMAIEDDDCLHYNWGASRNHKNIAVGTLLIDEAIRFSIGKNLSQFDFGSTPLSDDNLFAYKMRWGCRSYPVYRYYTRSMPLVLDLNSSYYFFRNMYSRLPTSIAVRMMANIVPWLVC